GMTPAVALTAYVRPEDEQLAIAAGYHRHVRKPVIVAELIATLAEVAAAPAVTGARPSSPPASSNLSAAPGQR
ncbi:MAG: hypothetical protein ABJC89_09020, partial [Acidobacteriota bacterium]